jgi:pimeloyl-ACP methyl ester carboxylesterase
MIHTVTNSDGITILRYGPDDIPEKRVFFIHGTLLHPGAYLRLFKMFPTWEFTCPTLIGHGLNTTDRGCLDPHKQLDMLTDAVGKPHDYDMLMGHSFGGTLAICLNETHPFKKVVLLAPAIQVADTIIEKQFLGIDINAYAPLWTLRLLSFLTSCLRFDIPAPKDQVDELTWTTSETIAVERKADPLIPTSTPASDVFPYLTVMREILMGLTGQSTLKHPQTRIIIGRYDKLIDVEETLEALSGFQVEPTVLDGIGHEIFNESIEKLDEFVRTVRA